MYSVRVSALLVSLLLGTWCCLVASQTQFTIGVDTKVAGDPFFNVGYPSCYTVNGVHQPVLNLTAGITYSFVMNSVSSIHPFYLMTSNEGGDGGASAISITGNGASGSSTFTFTPTSSTASPLYFECGNHMNMGNRINIVAAVVASSSSSSSSSSPSSSSSSSIASSSTRTSSSTSSLQSTSPSSTSTGRSSSSSSSVFSSTAVSSTVSTGITSSTASSSSDSTGSSSTGSPSSSSSESAVPAITVFSIGVTTKVAGDPFFGSGFTAEYTVNGVNAPQLSLLRGVTYTFNVNVPSIHPFFLGTDSTGGNGASSPLAGGVTSATFTFTPDASTPDLIYYECEVHMLMGNSIQVISSGSSSGMGHSNVNSAGSIRKVSTAFAVVAILALIM